MPAFLLLLLGLTAGCVRTQDSSEGIPAVVASPQKKVSGAGGGPGDPCEDHKCDSHRHTVCNNNTCTCDYQHPVVVDHEHCFKPVVLGEPCFHTVQCQYHVEHALCLEYSTNYSECKCRKHYEVRTIQGYPIPRQCFPDLESLKADVPTLLGLGLGMSMLSALICLVLKIFSRARFARPRRYADARINPPLTVSGQVSVESGGRVPAHGHKVYARRQSYPQRRVSALVLQPPHQHPTTDPHPGPRPPRKSASDDPSGARGVAGRGARSTPSLQQGPRETYAAFALAASNSSANSPARHHSLRSVKSASSSRRPSYASLHGLRPGSRRPSQASLRLVVGEGRGEPIGYYVCIRDPASVHSRGGSRRPSQASMASSSGDLRDSSGNRVHHFLYMRAANYSLASDTTNTTTGGTSDSSPRTPKSTEQLLAIYHPGPEHPVRGVGSSHTTSTLGSSSDDVFKEEDEDEEEEEQRRKRQKEKEEEEDDDDEDEEARARLIG